MITVFIGKSYAQNPRFVIHIYNPIGFFQKQGAKFEYRPNKMGFLPSGIQYYWVLPKYPGTQIGLESRYYLSPFAKRENFVYAKFFGGYQQQVDVSGDGFSFRAAVPGGSY